ncbi:MAG: hypothetical protein OIN85_10325 [Candidatus Methanoperedens sp.]|nr:hypothetical protein [Candidatus Methanoperedens sp.]
MEKKRNNNLSEGTKYPDFIKNVMRENDDFLKKFAKETNNEVSELMNDSVDYMSFFAKKGEENWAKSTMAFFTIHMLMPLSYAIYVDLLAGNIVVCFMELRLMLESLAKCYLADLKYPDSTFFQEKLELLEKETKSKNGKTISKREYDFMNEFDKELGFNECSIKLWGKLSKDWVHTKGIMDKVVYQIAEKSNVPPWGLVIPCNFLKADLEDIEELHKRISQFRNLLKITMKNYKQEFSFEKI